MPLKIVSRSLPAFILICFSSNNFAAEPFSPCGNPLRTLDSLYKEANADFILNPATAPNHALAHSQITQDLYNGEIVSINRFSENSNAQDIYKVVIKHKDPKTGEINTREAIFKPRPWGDAGGYNRTTMEYVAYYLNEKLGLDYVPPTAYRRGLNLQIDGKIFTEGAFIFKVPEFKAIEHILPERGFPFSHEAVRSDHRVLSVLLQNPDGHSRNLGIGTHWVDGKTRPVFIDWGASFKEGTNVTMTHYPSYGNSVPVIKIRRYTFEKLKKLTREDLEPLIKADFIKPQEANQILTTRDGIIKYFEGLKSPFLD